VPYGDTRRKIVTGDDKIHKNYVDCSLTRGGSFLDWIGSQLGNREKTMPVQPQEQETLNVKLVHFTKQNSPDEPVQLAFSVVDEQSKEDIIPGEIPYSYALFRLCQENGWLNIRRGVASIRESRTQRRAMSA